MEVIIVSSILAILIGIVQYFGECINKLCGKYLSYILSFSAGISITYIFIDLLPHFTSKAIAISNTLFLSLLFGFASIHLIEKHIYHHSVEKTIKKEFFIMNQISSFFYHFVVGIIIVGFTRQGFGIVITFFIPMIIFTAISALPIMQNPNYKINIVVSFSTFLGVIFSNFIILENYVEVTLLGIVIGIITFSVIRHLIPMGKEGKPLFFVIGMLVYIPIIMIGWFI
jgi:hypothetical protein